MSQEQQFCLLIQLARSSVVSAYPHLAKSVNLPYTVILERVHLGFIPEASASLLAALLTVVGLIVTLRLPQKAWQLLRESDRTQDEQKDHVD